MKNLAILLILLVLAAFALFKYQSASSSNSVLPTPTQFPVASAEVISFDGSSKLVMKVVSNDSFTNYSFTIVDKSGKNSTLLFSKSASEGETMSIPQNSWSPGNKYLFLADRVGGTINYLLFKTNGDSFSEGQKFVNVTSFFKSKTNGVTLKEVTGWDDPILMHVTTVNNHPFWFDVESQSFIQLVR